jgi:hypothetical protein
MLIGKSFDITIKITFRKFRVYHTKLNEIVTCTWNPRPRLYKYIYKFAGRHGLITGWALTLARGKAN